MRKGVIFISTALTTFMLVVIFGVVSAYQKAANSSIANVANQQVTTQQQADSQPVANAVSAQQQVILPTQAASTPLTAEAAAQMAVQILGRTDLYSVETSTWNGLEAYLVTFSSGDLVYISPAGQILAITKLQPVYVTNKRGGGGGGGGGGASGSSGGNHEGGEGGHEGGGDD